MSEIKRILKAGGLFITQQVGGMNSYNTSKFLNPDYKPAHPEHTLKNELQKFENEGFQILMKKEEFPKTKFFDLGAFVYFAKIIEWEYPDFSVEKCYDRLLKLHEKIKLNGYMEVDEHRFIIIAQKPQK